jgi:voltage-dependent potassium channel beta subunit
VQYRRLGRSGLQLSALSFGSWVTFGSQVDAAEAEKCMKTAFDAGVNFFDNAEEYAKGESEIVMGKVLKKFGWPRDSYCVSSKVYFGACSNPRPTQRGLSRKHVVEACHQALERLQVDYLDLYFCHRPDPETPIEETVHAMHTLIQQGKVLYWGTSEWSAEEIVEAHEAARRESLVAPVMEQPQYNMFVRNRVEQEYAPLYTQLGLGVTVWSPLASGFLTGKYNAGIPQDSRLNLEGYDWLKQRVFGENGQERIDKVKQLTTLADELDATMAQLALAWCLHNPHVSTVILGASRAAQLKENLQALRFVDALTEDAMQRINSILHS